MRLTLLLILASTFAHDSRVPEFKLLIAWETSGVDDTLVVNIGVAEIPRTIEEYKKLICQIRNTPVVGKTVLRSKPSDYSNIGINLYLGSAWAGDFVQGEEPVTKIGTYIEYGPEKGRLSIYWLNGKHLKHWEDYSFSPTAACSDEAEPEVQ